MLIELRQEWSDGKKRDRMLPLAEKLMGDEEGNEGAVRGGERGIVEELGQRLAGKSDEDKRKLIRMLPQTLKQRQEIKDSPSYPGLRACKSSCATIASFVR